MGDVTFYTVLGVPSDASQKEITKAYHRLARELHPDTNQDPEAAERFKLITDAYNTIGDGTRRAAYDAELRSVEAAREAEQAAAAYTYSAQYNSGDLDDMFTRLFGGNHSGMYRNARDGRRRGMDLEAAVSIGLLEALKGTTVSLRREDSKSCELCSGSGVVNGSPCAGCAGSGVTSDFRNVVVRIPPGTADGQTLRVPGRGTAGFKGGEPGDLFVTVTHLPHPSYSLDGINLVTHRSITYPQAVLGTEITLDTPQGDSVKLRVPEGTRPGRTLRARGRGAATARATGDLLVKIDVDVPKSLTPEERAAIVSLGELFSKRG